MDSISVPHCNGTVILDNGKIKFLPNEHYFVGIFYICFFIVAVIPQFFLMFTCLEKQHISLSCYKLMTIVCFCDMTNLVNCMLMAGIFTLFDIQHCNSGLWIISYGQFVMFFWYAYCIANLILAFNRLFEFLNKEVSTFFFEGNRCWFWLLGIFVYAASLCAFAPNPYYFYNAQAGVWFFFWLLPDPTNYYHIYNNMIKLGLMIVCYVLMLILLKRKLSAASGSVSDLQKRLSIQACLIASACAAGNITYVVISYMPMGNSPITGAVGEFLWGVQHSAAGFVYIVMNKSVKRNVFRLLCFLGFKAFASKTKLSIATKTVSVAPRSTTVVQHI
ncbi:hypothetical protein L596_020987 [Steinernema carpocapsae]|uniref:G-protein coupled receptors family 1 profile domain-containing protein n=1 Tax=Steinernema carpocapsae TaxID=34508 RepID=A0A4U5MV35_STECR|nr:hypothetical protein L596_020987 [Steinernema carpocapsae]